MRTIALSLFSFLLGVGALYIGERLLSAPGANETSVLYGDWRLTCPPASAAVSSCALMQMIADAKTRVQLAQFSVEPRRGARVLAVALPFDVLLQPGVGLSLGSGAVNTFPFTVCNENGCIAAVPLTADLRGALEGAEEGVLSFVGLDGKNHGVKFTLRGFADGVHAYDVEEARRGAWWKRLIPAQVL